MINMNRLYLFLILLSSTTFLFGQNQSIGSWQEYLPYNRGKMVADAGNKVFCATEDALFSYSKDDGTIERYTRLTGMHDFGISSIAYDFANEVLVVGYSNSNIDLIYDNAIFNLPFIKEKNITGSKNINSIYIKNGITYLACGFGIVTIDNVRQEIKDTYLIGANGSQMNVLDITSDNDNIYAATDTGIFAGALNSNLANFNNWSRILDDVNNNGDYNKIVAFGGKIYANYAKPDAQSTNSDELYVYENGSWNLFSIPELPTSPKRYSLRVLNNEIVVVNQNSLSVFNTSWQRLQYLDNTAYTTPQMRDAIKDNTKFWIADRRIGLVKFENNTGTAITPSGPTSAFVADMQVNKNVLWVAHGPKSTSWNPQDYPVDGFSTLKDNNWTSFNNFNHPELGQNSFSANMSLSIVPGTTDQIRVGSVVNGLLDFNNGVITRFYDENNSTLTPAIGNETQTQVHGITHDEDGNLWVCNSGVNNVFHVLKKDGTWKSFNTLGSVNGAPFAGYITIDNNNFKWVNLYGGGGTTTSGLAVLNDNNTIDNTQDDKVKYIPTEVYPRCMAVDFDGQLWVGTDEGPQVIYSPSAAFDENISLQKILIFQDNSYQYLLENEVITYITIDGANRKWIGTQTSGVYLLSPDGQNEIHHFTTENSPIFSNNITCIAIDKDNGKVYIGTDKGLISYQSDAIEGGDECKNVIVYPNPVEPGYSGPIAVRGVINNAKIKITDISGSVVYENTAIGGQAIWNGTNFKGEKSSTGVYLVFAADEDGNNACVTKLLFVK